VTHAAATQARRRTATNREPGADRAITFGEARPIGPHSLYWQCRIQGADTFRDSQPIDACPYSEDREFSGRAWRDGWRAAAVAAGVKLPHQLASVPKGNQTMIKFSLLAVAALLAALVGCGTDAPQPAPTVTATVTPSPTPEPTTPPTGASHTLAAVGDTCSTSGTTQQCAKTATAAAGFNPERLLHLGDYQYQNAGSNGATYKAGYEAAFAGLHDKTIPVYGSTHDTCDGSGSWECYPVSFMNSNGAPEVRGKLTDHQWGYSVDIDNWHVVVFNYKTTQGGSVGAVTADLDAHPSQCLLAITHAPVIGSPAEEHPTNEASAFRTTLVNHGVDLILNGHQHFYERNLDPSGFTAITNGLGGVGNYDRTSTASTAQAYNSTSFGPIKVVLSANGWTTDFVPNAGAAAFSDHASGGCS
jgi:acid phosphatase type 7